MPFIPSLKDVLILMGFHVSFRHLKKSTRDESSRTCLNLLAHEAWSSAAFFKRYIGESNRKKELLCGLKTISIAERSHRKFRQRPQSAPQ